MSELQVLELVTFQPLISASTSGQGIKVPHVTTVYVNDVVRQ